MTPSAKSIKEWRVVTKSKRFDGGEMVTRMAGGAVARFDPEDGLTYTIPGEERSLRVPMSALEDERWFAVGGEQ